jgi:hypothetical protein
MGMIESLYASAATAGLLKEVVWVVDQTSSPILAQVGFRAPDENLLDGLAMGRDYTITYPASSLAGLKARARLSVDGQAYQVREVRAVGDGSECRATLTLLPLLPLPALTRQS